MPNRNWTAATLYKRLAEVLKEEGINLDDDTQVAGITVGALRDKLRDRIVADAINPPAPQVAAKETAKK